MKEINVRVMVVVMLLFAVFTAQASAISGESADIMTINSVIHASGANWVAGNTSVSGLSSQEKLELTLPGKIPKPKRVIRSPPSARAFAEHFDWAENNGTTAVRSQGSCGSCWAFSAIAAMESAFLIDANKNLDLSEQYLVSKCCDAGNCGGGWPDEALKEARDVGIPDEACFPYRGRGSPCEVCDGWEDRAYKIKGLMSIESTADNFKWAIGEYGPLSVVIRVPDDWYYYRGGVYSPVTNVGWANHAVLLTGWDDADGCWIIKNSWGKGWGNEGYARVKYGNIEKYNYAYAVTGVVEHGATPDGTGWTKPVAAVASSEFAKQYSSMNAVDDDVLTDWFSKMYDVDPSITFDLGEVKTISKIRLMVYKRDAPMTVIVETSEDGVNWRTVAENAKIGSGSMYVTIPFASHRARYERVTETETNRQYGTVTECDVWVTGDDAVPMPTRTLTVTHDGMVETIILHSDVVNIVASENGRVICEWTAHLNNCTLTD